MKPIPENPQQLAEEIARTDEKLAALEREINAIGEPAAHALRTRLESLKIEEHALQRNFSESLGDENSNRERMQKIETLLHHIKREEASMQHEADFLSLCAPSSVSLAFKGGARLYDLGTRGIKRFLGDHLWHSPFVNRTHDGIVAKFHLPTKKEKS